MKKSSIPTDEEALRQSVKSFHQSFVGKLLNKWEERSTDKDKLIKRQEIEKRWLNKLGKMIPSELIAEKSPDKLQHIPYETTESHPLLAPIQTAEGMVALGAPQSKIAVSLPAAFKLRRVPQMVPQMVQCPSRLSTKRSDDNSEPPSKKRKVDSKAGTAVKLIGNGSEAILAGMKIFVHRPSLGSSLSSLSGNQHREDIERDIVEMRVVTIYRENIQTASKFITRTKLLLRENNGAEATIAWPSHAAYIDKDMLCQHILETIQCTTDDLPNLAAATEMQDGESSQLAASTVNPAMQETILDWLKNSGTKSASESSAAKSTEEPGSNVDEEEDGENFANKLMADFVDFSWCDEIQVFNEPAAAQASASAPVALPSSTVLNQEGSSAASSTQQSVAQVMLSSGEIISQEHLHDVEYYFERLQKQKPRFVLPSRNSNTDDSEILALHPIDDPTSRLPDPCCVLIGKAAKVKTYMQTCCREAELYFTACCHRLLAVSRSNTSFSKMCLCTSL